MSSTLNASPHYRIQQQPPWNYRRQQKQSSRNLENNIRYACPKCHKSYRHAHHMLRHFKFECDSPPRFQCPYCGMKSKQSNNVYKHIRVKHPGLKLEIIKLPYNQE
ncbi:hypothetical protein P5V15_004073 [Pogonomyrmex californicus]